MLSLDLYKTLGRWFYGETGNDRVFQRGGRECRRVPDDRWGRRTVAIWIKKCKIVKFNLKKIGSIILYPELKILPLSALWRRLAFAFRHSVLSLNLCSRRFQHLYRRGHSQLIRRRVSFRIQRTGSGWSRLCRTQIECRAGSVWVEYKIIIDSLDSSMSWENNVMQKTKPRCIQFIWKKKSNLNSYSFSPNLSFFLLFFANSSKLIMSEGPKSFRSS